MKKLITLIMIIGLFVSANVSYGYGDKTYNYYTYNSETNTYETVNETEATAIALAINKTEQQQGQKQGQKQSQQQGQSQDASNSQSQINEGNTTDVSIDNTTIIPAPIMPVPGFASPVGATNGIWTNSPFSTSKTIFTIAELRRVANPSRFLFLGWCEWDKSFQIEMACWDKAKPQKAIRVYSSDTPTIGFTKMGEAQAKAKELHKSERQVAAALCIYAAKQGAKVVVLHTFSNPVTKADSAVLGGAGASVTGSGDIVNSAGGFGWTTAEKVYRSYVVAELYN